MAKINFVNSGAVDIIRTTYYIRGLELMKLIFAILDVSLFLHIVIKQKVFLHLFWYRMHWTIVEYDR